MLLTTGPVALGRSPRNWASRQCGQQTKDAICGSRDKRDMTSSQAELRPQRWAGNSRVTRPVAVPFPNVHFGQRRAGIMTPPHPGVALGLGRPQRLERRGVGGLGEGGELVAVQKCAEQAVVIGACVVLSGPDVSAGEDGGDLVVLAVVVLVGGNDQQTVVCAGPVGVGAQVGL